MINILLADDQRLFIGMLKEMLAKDENIRITGMCSNGIEVMECFRREVPNIAVLDIGMPLQNGIDTLRLIKQTYPQTKVVILTTFEDERTILEALKYGAEGYLVKDLTTEALISAIKSVANGLVTYHSAVHKYLTNHLMINHTNKEQKLTVGGFTLDPMDVQIIKFIAKGKSNKEIGLLMNYTEGTIKNKVSRIFSVTGLADRTAISVFAIKHGLI
ncbi:MAG: response regulator transcription factor [Clostridia bacterium]|nr:response regulator transcription factor [Clostridia bacterium]